MRPVAQGRPGTEVIPTGWAAQHRPVVEKTMVDAIVELRDPTGLVSGWDEASEQVKASASPAYWSGGARVQILDQQGKQPVAAEDPESVANYLIVIPADVAPVEGHLVKVTAVDDQALQGRSLRILTVARGSEMWERDLFCELIT